jgi:cytochrome c5
VNNLMRMISAVVITLLLAVSVHAAMDDKSIKARTMPVGQVCVEGDACGAAAAPAGPQEPADIYSSACAACHGSGALGAPKLGDAAAWAPRIDKGIDTIIANAINGINSMPAMGACASCSEDDIAATVKYMAENSQ